MARPDTHLSPPPPPPPITDNSCAVWGLLRGGAGDKSLAYIYFLLEDHASVSSWLRAAPPTYLYVKVSRWGSAALLKDTLTKIEVGVAPLMLHLTYIMLQTSRASERCSVYGLDGSTRTFNRQIQSTLISSIV